MDTLERFFAAYADAWRSSEAAALAGFWRPERFALYKAEEVPEFFLDWSDVLAYWRGNERLHSRVALELGPFRTVPLGEARLLVPVRMRWHITFAPDARTPDGALSTHRGTKMAGENHVLCMFDVSGAEPKLCAWSETPDAPLSYFARLYRYVASSDELSQD